VELLAAIGRLFDHLAWADGLVLDALGRMSPAPETAVREYAHILGADEVWLSRLEQRPSRSAVWPTLTLAELGPLAAEMHRGYSAFLARLGENDLEAGVSYTNSAGQAFRTPVRDILLHVALHAHYHRGKVNLLLRQAGQAPAPADFIGFVRGVPAATTSATVR